MSIHWNPEADGVQFRSAEHDETTWCEDSSVTEYMCTRPAGHTGWHVASGSGRRVYDVWPPMLAIPVPDGMTPEDAQRILDEHDKWIEWDERRGMAPWGARVRDEFQPGKADTFRRFVHSDDVPDPDADLIEAMARALRDEADRRDHYVHTYDSLAPDAQEMYRSAARAALRVVREQEGQR